MTTFTVKDLIEKLKDCTPNGTLKIENSSETYRLIDIYTERGKLESFDKESFEFFLLFI